MINSQSLQIQSNNVFFCYIVVRVFGKYLKYVVPICRYDIELHLVQALYKLLYYDTGRMSKVVL